jgi:Kef-type K+ transport system membrane component KefB
MTDTHSFVQLLLVIAAVLVTARLLGVLAVALGQPAILGELLAGVVLGGSVLGILDPNDLAIKTLAELGLLILLFEIGLSTDLRALTKVGGTALIIAVVGVGLPFLFGYLALTQMGVGRLAAIVCGAALTATSIGVSTRVLSDLGFLQTQEGRVVLGTAVLDDIIGLVILSVVGGLAAGTAVTARGIARTSAVAFGFVVGAIAIGSFVIPPLFHGLRRLKSPTTIAVMGLSFAFCSRRSPVCSARRSSSAGSWPASSSIGSSTPIRCSSPRRRWGVCSFRSSSRRLARRLICALSRSRGRS